MVVVCTMGINMGSAAASSKALSKFVSSDDGWLDLSEYIDQTYGFVPVVMPITEPAVGYGAAGALVFIDKPTTESGAGSGRPNITVLGGMGTENGTKGLVAGDLRYWLDDRLITLVGAVHASVNLDFYGVGQDGLLKNNPLSYNIEPQGGLVQAKYRMGTSKSWAGLGYSLATTQVSFDAPAATPGLPDFQRESRVGGLIPSFTYDSRDNKWLRSRQNCGGNYGNASVWLVLPVSEMLGMILSALIILKPW